MDDKSRWLNNTTCRPQNNLPSPPRPVSSPRLWRPLYPHRETRPMKGWKERAARLTASARGGGKKEEEVGKKNLLGGFLIMVMCVWGLRWSSVRRQPAEGPWVPQGQRVGVTTPTVFCPPAFSPASALSVSHSGSAAFSHITSFTAPLPPALPCLTHEPGFWFITRQSAVSLLDYR